jgi:hypothetical protein
VPGGRSDLRASMPDDISLPAVTAMPSSGNAVSEPRTSPSGLQQPSPAVPKPPPIISPTLRLDAALGLVVIEFRNESGAITTSIPSQRQLEAYQRWTQTRIGPAPAHVVKGSAPAGPERGTDLQLPETTKR